MAVLCTTAALESVVYIIHDWTNSIYLVCNFPVTVVNLENILHTHLLAQTGLVTCTNPKRSFISHVLLTRRMSSSVHPSCTFFSLWISGRISLVVSCISAPRSLTLVRDPSHLTVPLTEVPLFTSMLLSSAIIPTSDHRSHTCRMHRACQTSHCLSVLMVCCQQELHMRPTTPPTWSNPGC